MWKINSINLILIISKFPFALDGEESGRIIIYGTAANPQMAFRSGLVG